VPEALVLGVTLRAGGVDPVLVMALALANLPEALSGTAGMRRSARSSAYVLTLWSAITLGTAATTALSFAFLSDLGPHALAMLKAFGAGALIAMAVETMIPEAFHNGPPFSGFLAAAGFAALIIAADFARETRQLLEHGKYRHRRPLRVQRRAADLDLMPRPRSRMALEVP
jgi:ZIP family zinc transporter